MHIGIIGYGIVGKSIHHFLQRHGLPQSFFFKKNVTTKKKSIEIWDQKAEFQQPKNKYKNIDDFIHHQDFCFVSPGIKLNHIDFDNPKILCELDIFSHVFKGNTIAITGSAGKTTITKIIAKILRDLGYNALECGNIGTPMLDIVDRSSCAHFLRRTQHVSSLILSSSKDMSEKKQINKLKDNPGSLPLKNNTAAILELSSFQLERNKHFAPHIGILSNIYHNHLDRHPTFNDYVAAKLMLFKYQKPSNYAILPESILDQKHLPFLKTLQSHPCFVITSTSTKNKKSLSKLKNYSIIHEKNKQVINMSTYKKNILENENSFASVEDIPQGVTFFENWLMVFAALYFYGIHVTALKNLFKKKVFRHFSLTNHEHRLEHFAIYQGVDFYNDSKSTILPSTLKAVTLLSSSKRHIILIIGGLSKGIDPAPQIQQLNTIPQIKKIISFGSKNTLKILTKHHFKDLSGVIKYVFLTISQGDIVLFSPGGASFDLFKSYKHRGQVFKEIVKLHIKNSQ
jgi:UDP-N-acetylmuramoylalanine--D-glutamate ligase